MTILKRIFPPLVPLTVAIAVLEILTRTGVIPEYLAPPPSQVLAALTTESLDIWLAMFETGWGAFLGLALSLIIGVALGILFSSSQMIQRVFYPYAVFFQTVPIISIAPLLVIWFGYGTPTVVASAFIVSVFPVIANTLIGMKSTDAALLDLFTLYGASGPAKLFKLKLPSSLPNILTGARIAGGLAVIGAIVGEFIGGGGLGGIVDAARTQQRLDRVFAAVLLASLLGLVFFAALNVVSRYLLQNWHVSEKT
jgi:NitT/TauT family transport system permease protein